MRTKPYLSLLIALLLALQAPAQTIENLWATGSAVPGQPQQLTRRPDGLFRFAGALESGELKVMTTATYQPGVTQFLRPQLVDSYLINYGLPFSLTTDESQDGWVVSFQEATYCFIVDVQSRRITGELLLPWNELLIAGSAFRGGSDNVEWKRDNMLPFERDHDDPYVFTWEGELGDFGGVEPAYFKLEGQMTWGPRELHPFEHGEDILQASRLRSGGSDSKWHVSQQGFYRLTVDLFNETIRAELLPGVNRAGHTAVDAIRPAETTPPLTRRYYDVQGRSHGALQRGLNIVRQPDGHVRKIVK